MALPTVLAPGDPGHLDHHEEIHELLSRLDGQMDALVTGVGQTLLADRPAAGASNLGLFWFAEDVPGLAYSDGSSWRDAILASTANSFTAVNEFQDDVFFGSGKPWVDPMHSDYGGTGEAADNNTTPLADAAADAAGGVLFLSPGTAWRVTSAVSIPADTDVMGKRASVFNNTSAAAVLNLNSGVRIYGLEVYNNGTASSYNDASRCITIFGTVGSYKSNIILSDLYLHSASYAVMADFASDVVVSNPRVYDIAYAGIGGTSVSRFHVLNPNVNMNNPVGTSGNAYGIYFSRNTPAASDLTTNPRSSECSVIGGVVRNVQLWHGLDTHGGDHIVFVGTSVLNCNRGIHIGPSNNGATPAVSTYAPHRCVADGLVIDSQVSNGTRANGVILQGASGIEHAEGCVVRAFIKGHGTQSIGTEAGLYMHYTKSARIDVTCVECSPNSVAIQSGNQQFHATITSADPWSTTAGRATHCFISGDDDTGVISSFVFGPSSKVATYVNTEGFRVSAGTGMDVVLGAGFNGATTPLVDVGNITRTTFRASTITTTGKLVTAASTTSRAGVNIPVGVLPSSPVDGDLMYVAGALYFRVGGTTKQIQFV